ncbi:MAG: GxxExxY protein [Bacteroidetes bacterium]|nr:GxxExxY protein [Bacteroidota bacterium]
MSQKYVNDLSYQIVGCAIEVHKYLGPGLLETVYEACFINELNSKKLANNVQVRVPIKYKNKDLGSYLVIDVLVENLIIVELKAVEQMNPLYKAQLLSYLKLTGKPKGLLINFNSVTITKDLRPFVTDVFQELPKE